MKPHNSDGPYRSGKIMRLLTSGISAILFMAASQPAESCDTWAASKLATREAIQMLAKNSDRLLFDSQPLRHYLRRQWPEGSTIDLGRLRIPQVSVTCATLGSGPYWCWGYEEGINEYGVAIGNEGVFTLPLARLIETEQQGKTVPPGLTGMDLIRLGLERGKTARESIEIMTALVETYGQFGSGMPTMGIEGSYDNSFLVADPHEIWILETAGRDWAAKQITEPVVSISNTLSLLKSWDLFSSGVQQLLRERGIDEDSWSFRDLMNDTSQSAIPRTGRADIRSGRSLQLLEERLGGIDPAWMMRIARDRESDPGLDLNQTASSCVALLTEPEKRLPVFWWSPAVPSAGCYIPFFVHGNQLPGSVQRAGMAGTNVMPPEQARPDEFSGDSFWWIFRRLSDAVAVNRPHRLPIVRAAFDSLEIGFSGELPDILDQATSRYREGRSDSAAAILDAFTARCVVTAEKTALRLQATLDRLEDIPPDLIPLLGTYHLDMAGDDDQILKITAQDGDLGVLLPTGMTLRMTPPDSGGFWRTPLTPNFYVSFGRTEEIVTSLQVHQITPLARKSDPDSIPPGIPEALRSFPGTYLLPVRNIPHTLHFQDGRFFLSVPDGNPEILAPDSTGRWRFADTDLYSLTFSRNAEGRVTAMNLHSTVIMKKEDPSIW